MRILTLSLATVLFVVFAAPAFAADWKMDTWKKQAATSEWEGYGVGTTFTKKVVMKSPMGNRTTQTRETLVKIEPTKFTIKVENQLPNGKWFATQRTEDRKKMTDFKFETKVLGQEAVTVAGKPYPCQKILGTRTAKDGTKDVMTFWEHATLGVLKYEAVIDPAKTGGAGKMPPTTRSATRKMTFQASKLDVSTTISGKSYTGREFTVKMPATGGMGGGTMTMRFAQGAPVSTVYQSSVMSYQGMEMSSTTEVIAITVKPLTAVTPK